MIRTTQLARVKAGGRREIAQFEAAFVSLRVRRFRIPGSLKGNGEALQPLLDGGCIVKLSIEQGDGLPAAGRERSRKTLVTALVLLATYLFLLFLSYGFPVSGDDWFFTTRYQDENAMEALQRGIDIAKGHYITTNGRILGNAFSGVFGCTGPGRELFRCALLLGVFLLVLSYCRIKTVPGYLLALAAVVALPPALFSQTYSWASGFFNYVPPALTLLLYLRVSSSLLEDPQKHDGPALGIGLLLLGFSGQLFVEHTTVAACLLGASVLGLYIRRRRLSWGLSGFLLGALGGAAVMFLAPGYGNINREGYRTVSHTFAGLFEDVRANFRSLTGFLTEDNWAVVLVLSGLCVSLLVRFQSQNRRDRALKTFALLAVTACPAFFYVDRAILSAMQYSGWINMLSFFAGLFMNLAYLAGVGAAALLCVPKGVRRTRVLLSLLAILFIAAPTLVVHPIGARLFYPPYILLLCVIFLLLEEALAGWKPFRKSLRIPAVAAAMVVLMGYSWICIWNGRVEAARTRFALEQIAQGASQVELPNYIYGDYVHAPNSTAMQTVWYREEPGDVEFSFIPYEEWVKGH